MEDKEYRALLQQRSYLIESLNAKKSSIENYNNYIEKADQNIIKNKMKLKDTKMVQVVEELNGIIKGLQEGIEKSKKQIIKSLRLVRS